MVVRKPGATTADITSNLLNVAVARYIKAYRAEHNLTQTGFGALVGMPHGVVMRTENWDQLIGENKEKRHILLTDVEQIASKLNVQVMEILNFGRDNVNAVEQHVARLEEVLEDILERAQKIPFLLEQIVHANNSIHTADVLISSGFVKSWTVQNEEMTHSMALMQLVEEQLDRTNHWKSDAGLVKDRIIREHTGIKALLDDK